MHLPQIYLKWNFWRRGRRERDGGSPLLGRRHLRGDQQRRVGARYRKRRHSGTLIPRARVARWFLFKPKIPICVNFGGSSNGRCWYILCPFGKFSCHLTYFMAIWYIFPSFGTFLPVLVCCTDKNLATLPGAVTYLNGFSSLTEKFRPGYKRRESAEAQSFCLTAFWKAALLTGWPDELVKKFAQWVKMSKLVRNFYREKLINHG
jgi:hypothetical protein